MFFEGSRRLGFGAPSLKASSKAIQISIFDFYNPVSPLTITNIEIYEWIGFVGKVSTESHGCSQTGFDFPDKPNPLASKNNPPFLRLNQKCLVIEPHSFHHFHQHHGETPTSKPLRLLWWSLEESQRAADFNGLGLGGGGAKPQLTQIK